MPKGNWNTGQCPCCLCEKDRQAWRAFKERVSRSDEDQRRLSEQSIKETGDLNSGAPLQSPAATRKIPLGYRPLQ